MSEIKKRELRYKFCIGFLENNIAKLLVEDDALNSLNKSDTEKPKGTGKSEPEKENLENKGDTEKPKGTGKSEPEKENLENKSDTENAGKSEP